MSSFSALKWLKFVPTYLHSRYCIQRIKCLKTKLLLSAVVLQPPSLFPFIQRSAELTPTILSSLIKLKAKKKKAWLPTHPPCNHPFIHPTNRSPQQQDSEPICTHIPLKGRADFLEMNWAHAKREEKEFLQQLGLFTFYSLAQSFLLQSLPVLKHRAKFLDSHKNKFFGFGLSNGVYGLNYWFS